MPRLAASAPSACCLIMAAPVGAALFSTRQKYSPRGIFPGCMPARSHVNISRGLHYMLFDVHSAYTSQIECLILRMATDVVLSSRRHCRCPHRRLSHCVNRDLYGVTISSSYPHGRSSASASCEQCNSTHALAAAALKFAQALCWLTGCDCCAQLPLYQSSAAFEE